MASRRAGPPTEPPQRIYTAIRALGPIRVDGKPNEPTWQRAPKDDRFQERQPNLGATPPIRTTVQVAYDDEALYVFIDAQSKPGDVRVRTLRRDNPGIFGDDAVYVKIDPAFTKRDAVSLGVNADGAQIDVLGLDDGREFIREWDAVWSAETVRRDDGYTAEFRIPFAVLGIKSADEQSIGFNISRDHPTRNATYDWRIFIPPRSPMAASQFGELRGLRKIRAQRALEYTPFAVARSDFSGNFSADPSRRPNVSMGADARLQVGERSYVEVSFLTDFAQVEADEVQVARDRFPLFFPERRAFFINGLEIFNFGRPRQAQLFFSRRVGLVDGAPVPILGGAKVYGRKGRVSYGLLNVQTLGTPQDEARGVLDTSAENYSVARVRVQATKGLSVGTMLLGQHKFGVTDQDNASGGLDAQYLALGGKLQASGFVAGTYVQRPELAPGLDAESNEAGPGAPASADLGSSAQATAQWRGLYFRPSMSWLWSDRKFDPVLGFYRRTGASRQEARVDFVPRPRILGLRDISFGPSYAIETTPGYQSRLGQVATGRLAFNFNNGSNLGYNISHFVDNLQDPFVLYLYTVDAGLYSGFRHSVMANSPGRRAVRVGARYEYVDLFGGAAHQPSANITARMGKHVTLTGRYTHLIGHLADVDSQFSFGFANGSADFAITRNLAIDNAVRLDLSPGRKRVGLQSRLRWRFQPGSDIFFVYRTVQPLGPDPVGLPARAPFNELTLKFTYYLRTFL